jgi:hypothetical protein
MTEKSIFLGLYQVHEVPYLIKFDDEHAKAKLGLDNYKQTWRYFLLSINIMIVLNHVRNFSPVLLMSAFTNWGLLLTILSIYLTIRGARNINCH